MEWNGMEWNGMEWNGMEWNGMEWNGMEWNGMEWNGMEWNGMELSGMEWNGMEWNGVKRSRVIKKQFHNHAAIPLKALKSIRNRFAVEFNRLDIAFRMTWLSLFNHYAIALRVLRNRSAIALPIALDRFAIKLQSSCNIFLNVSGRFEIALRLLIVIDLQSPCYAIAMQ
jgi:hypothetical protein